MNVRTGTLKPALLAASIALLAATLPAEELRALVAGSATLSAEAAEGSKLTMGYADAIALAFPKDSPFVQGFEIEVKAPPAFLALPGSLAWELWRRVDPEPDKNRFGYSGERLITQPLPARAGFVLQVPVRKDHSLKSGPYVTVLPLLAEQKDFPFIFRLVPVTKGIPSSLESAQFQVRVRPLLTDEGGVRLSFRYPDPAARDPLTVSIDDRRVDQRILEGREPLILKPGTHYLRVSSEAYRDESRSFPVEQGKVTELVVELQGTAPLVIVEAPDSAAVLFDGQRIDHVARPSFPIEPGEHVVSCRIGDYSVQRKFQAFKGKTYRIVLNVELQVQEGP